MLEAVSPPAPMNAMTHNENRTFGISVLLGILLGSGYAVMQHLMSRKVTTQQDIESFLNLPVLAVVPEESSLVEALAQHNKKSAWQKCQYEGQHLKR